MVLPEKAIKGLSPRIIEGGPHSEPYLLVNIKQIWAKPGAALTILLLLID